MDPVWRIRHPLSFAAVPRIGTWPLGLVVALLALGQVALWGFLGGALHTAPEIDSAEQFVWAFSLESGYWKHPPAPSWIMHGLLALFGPSIRLPLFAAHASIAIALALSWRLGCEFMTPRRALIAMAMTSLVTYHNIGGDNFNHNTALLPFQAATVLLFYLATRRGHFHLWALTGLFAGLSMLVKYVALMPIVALLAYAAFDRSLHTRRVALGLVVATAIFALVLLPHGLWLHQTDFLPFRYAQSVAEASPGVASSIRSVGGYLLMQTLRILPMAICMAILFVFGPERGTVSDAPPPAQRDRRFLAFVALGPILMTLAFAICTRTELQSRWGANAFLLAGLFVMAYTRWPDRAPTLRWAIGLAMFVHVAFAVGMTLGKTVLSSHFHHRTRANFPGAVLATEAQQIWKAHTDAPLRIIVSDIWLGGNVVANSSQRVAIVIDGHRFKSPWVKEGAIRDCGALVLDDLTSDGKTEPNPALDAVMGRASHTGLLHLPWAVPQARADAQKTGTVRWGVIEPRDPAACQIR